MQLHDSAVTKSSQPPESSGRVNLSETNQREVTEWRNQAALHQLHALRAGKPSRVTRPGELSGPETKPTHHRLQFLLDEAAHAGIRADAREDDQLATRPQHARELVQCRFRIRHRGDDIL